MEEKAKKLAFYFDELELAFSKNEVKEKLEKLDEKELDILTIMCEEILNYEDGMREELASVRPEDFEKIEKEYLDKKLELQKKLNGELEESQRIYDKEMEEIYSVSTPDGEDSSEPALKPQNP
jgi:hypothetical protein